MAKKSKEAARKSSEVDSDNKFFSPKDDIVFKMLFGDVHNIEHLTAFLQAVLSLPEEEYAEVTITDPHTTRTHPKDKLSILDVSVKTKSGKLINVEIQLAREGMIERVLYYLAKMLTAQMSKKMKYTDIKQVISIVITNFEMVKKGKSYHSCFKLYDSKAALELTDLIEVDILELPKLPEIADGTELWNWMRFLSAESKEDLAGIAERSPQMKKVVGRYAELTEDERARLIEHYRQKAEWDAEARESYVRNEGREEGLAEGLTQGHEEGLAEARAMMAKNLLDKQMPLDEIASITGLSQEAVEALQVSC